MRTRSLVAASILALAALAPRPSRAQSDDTITQEVRTRFREGVDLFDQGHFEAARAKFKQAYALKPLPDILYNLAWSSLKSGHPVDGEREFQKFLHEAKDIEPATRDEAMKGLADAKSKNGHIEIAAPPGADVYVDGERVGTSPVADPVPVEPGAHVVKYAPNDAAPQSQSVSVLAGRTEVARFGGAVAAPVPPAPSSTASETPPTPPDSSSPSTGETPHDGTSPTASSSPAGGEKTPLVRTSIWPRDPTPLAVGAVVTVGAFVTAVVMGVVKSNAQDNANSVAAQITAHGGHNGTCTNPSATFAKACSTLNDDDSAVNTDATVANVMVGVGFVALAGTIVYWVLAPKAQKGMVSGSSATWIAPIVTGHQGGIAVGGSF